MSAPPILSLQGIRFSYNGSAIPVLRDLSLDIPAAAVTAILGPNGSGKSTLLSVLLGMRAPQAGTLHLNGQGRQAYSRDAASRLMGLVPQQEDFPLGFSVLQYVLLGRAPHLGLLGRPGPADHDIAWSALETTGLTALARRLVPSLSGGERQLATVARALAQQPRILLLDEPTSHLDLANKRRVLDVIRAQVQDGVTVILTTHDPNVASAVADHVVLMRAGQTVATGPRETVMDAANLSATYDVPVEVTYVRGRPVVLAL